MPSITTHELWEELLFGDSNHYETVVDDFPSKVKEMHVPEVGRHDEFRPHAEQVVYMILDGELYYEISSRLRHRDTFTEFLKSKLADIAQECPASLIQEVVKRLPADLDNPEELPVRWSHDNKPST